MTTFSVRFLGCKVSHVDAHALRERLLADGHEECDAGADVAVVNTCCVTNEAVAKSRKEAARAARTHRRVYVTGCGANLAGDAFAGLPDNVVVVARRSEETPEFVAGDVGAIGCVQADARLDRVRAFVKVQDGCSFSCRFCVIPLVRGASRSRPADAVLRRSAGASPRAIARSCSPVSTSAATATAMPATTLPRLVRDAGATPGLERLRLSSIEINHVDDELVAALRETPTASRHLHVPLQSGDDDVLHAMGRRYTVATFLRRLEPLQQDFNLTSDVIVGFPAEDEAASRTRSASSTKRASRRCTSSRTLRAPAPAPRGRLRAAAGEEGAERTAARSAPTRACLAHWHSKIGARRRRARRPARPGVRRRLLPVARARMRRSASWSRVRGARGLRRGDPRRVNDDCLFCTLYRDGDHVAATDGFVAIRDINPQAPTHLLVLPERHIDSFREIGEFPPDEAKRMLDFVAEVAAGDGLDGLPCRRQRRPDGGPDDFPSALARLGGG